MFKKILIANRGEIACRVMQTAHRLGIRVVAVYSEADANALHVSMADEAYCIGPAPSAESYLCGDKILQVAKQSGATAIHPGYGFLSENAAFVKACEAEGISFIGPSASAIEAMGSKSAAKTIMEKAGVPLVPGYHGDDQAPEILQQSANQMGYPVLLKATAGGGGKGMRIVWSEKEFDEALDSAKREALKGFGDDRMLVEKYLTQPRHVEIQVFADKQGNAVYLFERDCSVQRRHQKVLEEAPAPGMTEALRQQMGEAAVKAAKAIDYVGAGTVEFLLDQDGSFYFMEMNTRLQVEHPVTELISGQDLVEWQLQVAAGDSLPLQQHELRLQGHALEARIYAEDPDNDFLPATGNLTYLRTPLENRHVRIDSGVREGDEVSVYYDPMIAKLIVWDQSRDRALSRMSQALLEFRVAGMKTNTSFLKRLVDHAAFQQAELDTGFIDKHQAELFPPRQSKVQEHRNIAIAALFILLLQQQSRVVAAAASNDPHSPWFSLSGWRVNESNLQRVKLSIPDSELPNIEVDAELTGNGYVLRLDGEKILASGRLQNDQLVVNLNGHQSTVGVVEADGHITLFTEQGVCEYLWYKPGIEEHLFEQDEGTLTAPMNGTIVAVLASPGAQVEADQGLIVMEAMKMEYTIRAPANGVVSDVFFKEGDLVDEGVQLVAFEAEGENGG